MLNERIKQLRLAYKLNQVEFGRKLGVTKQCVSNWENNNIQPSVEMLVKIADLFSVTTDYLLGRDDKKYLDISSLTDVQIIHIQDIINDIRDR
ncbi:MAG TPA: helix-turn-helix domain-containing protein [Candidatus Blautia intestinipullorum]|nr:helix-turn-helix domain-containing protein [Candidatus Blautia intestinipullorum]